MLSEEEVEIGAEEEEEDDDDVAGSCEFDSTDRRMVAVSLRGFPSPVCIAV